MILDRLGTGTPPILGLLAHPNEPGADQQRVTCALPMPNEHSPVVKPIFSVLVVDPSPWLLGVKLSHVQWAVRVDRPPQRAKSVPSI